jgi:hypothetical protein
MPFCFLAPPCDEEEEKTEIISPLFSPAHSEKRSKANHSPSDNDMPDINKRAGKTIH